MYYKYVNSHHYQSIRVFFYWLLEFSFKKLQIILYVSLSQIE